MPSRTAEEVQRMITAAHTSLYHWQQVGNSVHQLCGNPRGGGLLGSRLAGTCALPHAVAAFAMCEQAAINRRNLIGLASTAAWRSRCGGWKSLKVPRRIRRWRKRRWRTYTMRKRLRRSRDFIRWNELVGPTDLTPPAVCYNGRCNKPPRRNDADESRLHCRNRAGRENHLRRLA